MLTIDNQRIRLAIDTSQMANINDVLTGNAPMFWNGVDLQFELGIFRGAVLAGIGNFDSITLDLKEADPRTGLPLMSRTIASGALNQALTLDAWNGGAATDCHALITFTNEQSNLDLDDDTVQFWLVISALTSDSPAHKIVLGATVLTVEEGGEGVEPPAAVVTPAYYTAAQSDARYSHTVDLTSINTQLTTLGTEAAAAQTTASAALPLTGGALTGALTIQSLSGVLKASAGLVAGSATTSDLPEGANLYWTVPRFTTQLATRTNVANGVCPLDSGGLVPAANLPASATRNTFSVSSQALMLALTANQGDIAIRTDLDQTFVLAALPASTLGNWSEFLSPASAVTSVNGLTGAVTLTTSPIAEGTNLYYTTARVHTDALTSPLNTLYTGAGGVISSADTIISALGKHEYRLAIDDAKVTGSDRVKLDGSTPMTGGLTFSGTGNPGIQASNLTDAQRAALTPANGQLIYNTTLSQLQFYNGNWQLLGGSGSVLLNGSGAPGGTLGVNGNYYLDTATGNIWQKASGTWSILWSLASSGLTFTADITFADSLSATLFWGNGWVTQQTSGTWSVGNPAYTGGLELEPSTTVLGVGHIDIVATAAAGSNAPTA